MVATRDEFNALSENLTKARTERFDNKTIIQVVLDGGSIPAGARATYNYLKSEVAKRGLTAEVDFTSSYGAMWAEPTVFIKKPGNPRVLYEHVDTKRAEELLNRYVQGDDPCAEYALAWVHHDPHHWADFAYRNDEGDEEWRGILPVSKIDWGKSQHRISLRNCGHINPESIEDFIAVGGYQALLKALLDMSYDDIIAEVKASGLRGRGGAGLAANIKWEGGRREKRTPKYIVVNGHEGEPNVFKDRRLFEGDPHSVLEGLLIGAVCTGIPNAYIYVGSEHPLAFKRMGKAVEDARKMGLLGENILGTGFSCDVKVIIAAGAYISGEASTMLYGIQGMRGMPRSKPPRSIEAGLWGLPTVVNNVETFNNMPEIMLKGGAWYGQFGEFKSRGTKVISLSGPFKRPCLAEVEMGKPIDRTIYELAGGSADPNHPIRAVQTGAVSGGSFPASMFKDVPFDIEFFAKYDCLLGSGSFTAITDQQCIVDAAYYILRFNRDESCGKCIPCRIGNEGLTEILWRIMQGDGKEEDVNKLLGLSDMVIQHSLCGLGTAAPLPLKNMILHIPEFKEELLQHIRSGYCRANVCPMDHHPAHTPNIGILSTTI